MSSLSTGHDRILALDLGARRIGLAVSDELGITAQGLETLVRTNKRTDFAALSAIAAEKQVRLILLGNPLRMNGDAGTRTQWTLEFAEDLRRRTGIEVRLWDERLTSVEAERVLQGSGIANDKRKAAIDRLSAVILLQSYLDSLGERPI